MVGHPDLKILGYRFTLPWLSQWYHMRLSTNNVWSHYSLCVVNHKIILGYFKSLEVALILIRSFRGLLKCYDCIHHDSYGWIKSLEGIFGICDPPSVGPSNSYGGYVICNLGSECTEATAVIHFNHLTSDLRR